MISCVDAGRVAVVDHRVDEVLEAERHLASVPSEERGAGGEPASRAGAADDETWTVDSVVVKAGVEPLQARVAVVDVRGVLVLGREAIVDRGDDAPEVGVPTSCT